MFAMCCAFIVVTFKFLIDIIYIRYMRQEVSCYIDFCL